MAARDRSRATARVCATDRVRAADRAAPGPGVEMDDGGAGEFVFEGLARGRRAVGAAGALGPPAAPGHDRCSFGPARARRALGPMNSAWAKGRGRRLTVGTGGGA